MPTRRPVRIALIAIATILVVVLGAGAVLIARFDPNSYKPDIVLAVKHATGRDLALNGKIALKPSLWPTIQVGDAAFSNPPGFSRPQMATLQGLELQLSLLPLLSHRIEIDRLVLMHPDILLETDAAGHSNWQMTPEASPSAPGGPQAPAEPGKAKTSVSVNTIRIVDGTLAYRDGKTNTVTTLGLPKFEAKSSSPDSPLHADGDAIYNSIAFNLVADTGSLNRLQDRAATAPWPVKLTLTAGKAKLAAEGSMTHPLQGKGYDLAVNGAVPDVSALVPLLQGFVPPPLHDVAFSARIADKGGKLPEFSTLTLHVGASDLNAQVPGLTLTQLNVAATAADQPVKVDFAGTLGDQPVTVAASTGKLALLMPAAKPAPFPIDATFQAAGATITAKGTIADAQAMTGANVVLAANIPDLSALSQLARTPLPTVKQIAFQATMSDAQGGFRNGAVLQGMNLTTTIGDLTGDAAIGLGARKALTANLKSSHIDLDALQTALAPPPEPAPTAAKPAPPTAKRSDRLFSDQPIPFDLLRSADADLKLGIADLRTSGADYKAIDTRAVLKDGKLRVDPFAADLPGGHLSGTMTADATQPAPPVHIALHAPGLALQTILAAAHQPGYANGNLEVFANLHGAGDTPHAIAASLDGSLGLAIAGGTIDNRLLGSLLGKVMDTLNALNLVGKGGNSELKCFAMRMDAQHGIGTFKALALSSSLLTMTGDGAVNLGDETLAMRLRPQAKVARTDVVVPVNLTGPIRNPAVKVNQLGAAESNAGAVAGAVIGNATSLGIVGGLLGGDRLLGGGTTDICTPALAAARGQAVTEAAPAPASASGESPAIGPAARPASPNSGAANPGVTNPGAILKNLFR